MTVVEGRELRDMMTDPTTVACRIFVGSLPTDNMSTNDLVQLFETHGKIAGAMTNRGFGFVQFVNEDGARTAVAANGKVFFQNRKLDIKPARPIKRPDERERSPIADKGREPTRFPVRNKFHNPQNHSSNNKPTDRANDCEIIVCNKNQTYSGYAEYIEQKLRRVGLNVDLLFPNEDVPVGRVLSNIANRGCKFAVVITPQNEEHRSITLNILHGPPQEHRNMPLEDAVALVSQKFEEFMVPSQTRPADVVVPRAVPILAPVLEPIPSHIQTFINLLAENRTLTVLQIDQLIVYLQKKREVQLRLELGDAAANVPSLAPTLAAPASEVHQNLQNRILNILNKQTNAAVQPAPAPVPAPASVSKTAPLLSDPNLQQALSSLFQGDLLRKFAK